MRVSSLARGTVVVAATATTFTAAAVVAPAAVRSAADGPAVSSVTVSPSRAVLGTGTVPITVTAQIIDADGVAAATAVFANADEDDFPVRLTTTAADRTSATWTGKDAFATGDFPGRWAVVAVVVDDGAGSTSVVDVSGRRATVDVRYAVSVAVPQVSATRVAPGSPVFLASRLTDRSDRSPIAGVRVYVDALTPGAPAWRTLGYTGARTGGRLGFRVPAVTTTTQYRFRFTGNDAFVRGTSRLTTVTVAGAA